MEKYNKIMHFYYFLAVLGHFRFWDQFWAGNFETKRSKTTPAARNPIKNRFWYFFGFIFIFLFLLLQVLVYNLLKHKLNHLIVQDLEILFKYQQI